MKRLTALVLALALLLPLLALAAGFDLKGMSDEELDALEKALAAERQNRALTGTGYLLVGTYDDATIGLKKVESAARDGRKMLVLTFDFSHHGEEPKAFMLSASLVVRQDGAELEPAYLYSGPGVMDAINPVEKGKTAEIVRAFDLRSDAPVTIELNTLFNFTGRHPETLTVDVP